MLLYRQKENYPSLIIQNLILPTLSITHGITIFKPYQGQNSASLWIINDPITQSHSQVRGEESEGARGEESEGARGEESEVSEETPGGLCPQQAASSLPASSVTLRGPTRQHPN